MEKKKIFLTILFIICISSICFAETIVLKSGQTVEGTIIEETDRYVKIDFQGIPLTYYHEDIEEIIKIDTPKETLPEMIRIKGDSSSDKKTEKSSTSSGSKIVEIEKDPHSNGKKKIKIPLTVYY